MKSTKIPRKHLNTLWWHTSVLYSLTHN